MTYQQTLTAYGTPIDGRSLLGKMLERKRHALSKGILLPDNFIAAVEEFASRNKLSNVHPISSDAACPRCLKAFMLSEASAHGLATDAKKVIESMMPGEAGHNGYYLDNEEVKPVQVEV